MHKNNINIYFPDPYRWFQDIETKPPEIHGGTEIAGKHRVICPPLYLQRRRTWGMATRWVGCMVQWILMSTSYLLTAQSACYSSIMPSWLRYLFSNLTFCWFGAAKVNIFRQSVLGLQYNLESSIASTRLRLKLVDLHGTSVPRIFGIGYFCTTRRNGSTQPAPTKGDTGLAPNGSKGVMAEILPPPGTWDVKSPVSNDAIKYLLIGVGFQCSTL